MHATCPAHILLDLIIIIIIFLDEYKLCILSLCSFLQHPFTFSLRLRYKYCTQEYGL
jgi:hypothetical protein